MVSFTRPRLLDVRCWTKEELRTQMEESGNYPKDITVSFVKCSYKKQGILASPATDLWLQVIAEEIAYLYVIRFFSLPCDHALYTKPMLQFNFTTSVQQEGGGNNHQIKTQESRLPNAQLNTQTSTLEISLCLTVLLVPSKCYFWLHKNPSPEGHKENPLCQTDQ